MAKTPEAALKFMDALVPGVDGKGGERSQGHPGADRRAEGRLQVAAVGLGFLLPSRCARQSTTWTKSQIKPYFELNNVLQNGVFYAANQLYGLTFKERNDIPGLPARTCACSRCSTPTASRWRCGTATTSSATTRTAAPGWTTSSTSRSCSARSRWSTTSPTSASPRRASRRCSASTT